MTFGHIQRQRLVAERWFNFSAAMLGAGLLALTAIVTLLAVEMRMLVENHQADKEKIGLLTMMSNAADVGQLIRLETMTQRRAVADVAAAIPAAASSIVAHSGFGDPAVIEPISGSAPGDIAAIRGREDEAVARVVQDSTVSSILKDELGRFAAAARLLMTANRAPGADGIAALRDAFAHESDALRRAGRRMLDAMVHHDVDHDIAAAKLLLGLGLLAILALVLIAVLVVNELGLRKNAMAGVAQAREAVARAERTRSRFLQAVGHDLRQPLQAIMLFTNGLERRVRDEEARALLAHLRAAVDSMRRMLSGLMDVSRLDAGVVSAEPAVVPVDDILRSIEAEFGSLAAEKGVLFNVVASGLHVRTDPVMVECILRNLVSNAVRFTSAGEVSVQCRGEGMNCYVEVTDSGPGIPDEEKIRIFQEFYRVAATSRQAEGLGLGLAIVKRMVNLLGVRIDLRSTVGIGTTFTLTLPLAAAAAPAPARLPERPASRDALAGTRVLVVDDDERVGQALAAELVLRGVFVTVLKSPGAVCALFAGEDPPDFDMALVDRDLNAEMTGPNLLDHLAARFKIALPAVILSGSADFRVIQELQGCDYPWLAKPVPLPALLREMSRVLDCEMALTAPA